MSNNENKALPSGLRADFDSFAAEYGEEPTELAFQAYRFAHNAQQAIIDHLMLEHCPDEMTAEQVRIWGDSQRRVEEDSCNHTLRYAGNGIVQCIHCEEINEEASDCGSDL